MRGFWKFALLGACCLGGPGPALAERIIAVQADPLTLYARPDSSTPQRRIAPKDLPWQVVRAEKDFLLVRLDGAEYWIDALDVRVDRRSPSSQAGCAGRAPPAAVAGVPGALPQRSCR